MRRAILSAPLSRLALGAKAILMIEKLLHRGDRPCRVFFLGGMSQILENHKRASSNIAVKTLGVFWRDEAIPASPDDKVGSFNSGMRCARLPPCH